MARRKPAKKPDAVTLDNVTALFLTIAAAAEKDPSILDEYTKPREGNPVTLGPRVPSATDMADRQKTNAAAAAEHYAARVTAPRKDPIKRMKESVAAYENGVRASLTEKRWEKAIDKIDEDGMYATLREGGAELFRRGVELKARKYAAKAPKLQEMIAASVAALDKMKTDTPEQREAKMVANLRNMRAMKGKI